MNKEKAEVGDTIEITRFSSENYGKEFVVIATDDDGRSWIVQTNGREAWTIPENYEIVHRPNGHSQTQNKQCPECKGSGIVLLFNFSSPCKMCGG